jgi:hypothetical protein
MFLQSFADKFDKIERKVVDDRPHKVKIQIGKPPTKTALLKRTSNVKIKFYNEVSLKV